MEARNEERNMERDINGHRLRLIQGDITEAQTDAIVNAANGSLAPGAGVSGAIHGRGGPEIAREARAIGGCPTGSAVATGAGTLPQRHVIHAVAPVWQGGGQREREMLASAYRRSLEVADELEDRSIAFPSLGTGIYGNPLEPSARIALQTVIDYLRGETGIAEVIFVLFTPADLRAYEEVLAVIEDE
jgi:O-acetyl-ADP-ribose deacetylase (regulator of RNase III)